jgi:hypothetical protein
MRRVFIPPEVLSSPREMGNPVMNHHRLKLPKDDAFHRKHLSELYPDYRQQSPSDTHSFSLFAPRLAKTERVMDGLRDLPEVIIAQQNIDMKVTK